MASASISTAIITVAGVIMASMLAIALLSQIGAVDSALRIASENVIEKMRTSIDIVQVAQNGTYFVVYIKNVGSRDISHGELEKTDIYFGPECDRLYVYNTSGLWIWNYSETDVDGVWSSGETLIVRIYNGTNLGDPPYCIRIVLPNGVSDEDTYTG
ncbi:MAG: hypothetical protein DRO12_05000 [Thermoprotei archaeon]|nr:MAG: hypothetical protein DRO12_05000 [Thermoprotei archaeon]